MCIDHEVEQLGRVCIKSRTSVKTSLIVTFYFSPIKTPRDKNIHFKNILHTQRNGFFFLFSRRATTEVLGAEVEGGRDNGDD